MSGPMRSIPTIVWDMDDVLNDLTRAWLETAWLPGRPDCSLSYHDLRTNPPHRLLGVTESEYLASLDRFRLSPEAARMSPSPELLGWFIENGSRYRHVALTARPRQTVGAGIQWLLEHLGPWFQTFAFIPSPRPGVASEQPDRCKKDYLAWLDKADIFIDDNAENCLGAEELGIQAFLIAQPWNDSSLTMGDVLKRLTSPEAP